VAPYQNPEKRDSHDSIKVLFGLNSKAEIYLPVGRRCPKGLDYYTDGLASKRISTRIQDFMLPVGLRFLLEWGWIKPRLTSESQRVRESESQRVRESESQRVLYFAISPRLRALGKKREKCN
jgi:hypothetical protein